MDDVTQPTVGIVGESLNILLVEHDAGDARRVEQALEFTGAKYRLELQTSSEEALARLRQTLEQVANPTPELIFVDLHLPNRAARGLLAEIHCHDRLRKIPVVVLASPLSDDASMEALDLAARFCVHKTAELPIFADRLRQALRCCLGDFPLHVDANDPVGQSRVAEALVFKNRVARPRRDDAPRTADKTIWQPLRRETSFWRRRSA